MSGFTLTARQTALLSEIIEATRTTSGHPVSWLGLEMIRDLVNADTIGLTSLDSTLPRCVFEQWIERGTQGVDTETVAQARINPFWQRYWDPEKGCSYPDRTGDYDWVNRASDVQSMRQRKRAYDGDASDFYQRCMTGCMPGRGPGRYTRIRVFRQGSDFSDRDVFLLMLLKPHVEQAVVRALAANDVIARLTRRELQILSLAREGFTNQQIARRSGVSAGTVHTHLINIYSKLGVQNRMAAVHRVFDAPALRPSPGSGAELPSRR
jgi:DNA-binding CsgD family transcriptional regulator